MNMCNKNCLQCKHQKEINDEFENEDFSVEFNFHKGVGSFIGFLWYNLIKNNERFYIYDTSFTLPLFKGENVPILNMNELRNKVKKILK
jgi:hypothetical protein